MSRTSSPSEVFLVSKTEDVVTPESAENADFDHDLSGHVYKNEKMSLKQVLRELRDIDAPESCHGLEHQIHGDSLSLYGSGEDTDYRTGHVSTYAIHLKAKPRNLKRLVQAACSRKKR